MLKTGGLFFLYGPFNVSGQYTSPSNKTFDEWLRSSDPSYGIRDMEAVEALALSANLVLLEQRKMPANNFCLVFQKQEQVDP